MSSGVILVLSDGTNGSNAALEHCIASSKEAAENGGSQLVALRKADLESEYAANQPVDEKGKKKGGASPPVAQLLLQRIESDEARRLTLESKASPENAEGAPAVVYLLSDFPSTADEAEQLIKASTESRGMLDGVLHFVWRPGMQAAGGNSRSGGGSRGGSSSGAMASSVGAFNSLPHLEQTRTAAAASRAAKKAKEEQLAETSAADQLAASMAMDEAAGEVGEEDEEEKDDKMKLGARRKSFELPAPLSRWAPKTTKQRDSLSNGPSNALFEKLLDLSEKNTRTAAWSDLWFAEVLCNLNEVDEATGEVVPRPMEAVLDEATSIATSKANDRNNFRAWLRSVINVAVPENAEAVMRARQASSDAEAQVSLLDPMRTRGRLEAEASHTVAKKHKHSEDPGHMSVSLWASDDKLSCYARLVSEVPDANLSSGVVLFCLVEAVVLASEFHYTKAEVPTEASSPEAAPSVGEAASASDAGAVGAVEAGEGGFGTGGGVSNAGPSAEGAQVHSEGNQEAEITSTEEVRSHLGPGTVALDYGDASGLRAALTEIIFSDGASPEVNWLKLNSRFIIRLERSAFGAIQAPRLMGYGALPLVPPLSVHQRGVEKSELLTFSDMSPGDIDATRQMMCFEEMLNSRYTAATVKNYAPWSFVGRSVSEKLPSHVFKQVLSRACLSQPEVLHFYDRTADQLLVALYHPTARHRCGEKVWNATQAISTRPPFPNWSAPESTAELTPRTRDAMTGMLDLRSDELAKTSSLTTKLFPSDHGLIVLSRYQALPLAWLSCYRDEYIFGLRASPHAARPFLEGKRGGGSSHKSGEPSTASAHVAHFVADCEDDVRVVVSEGSTHPAKNTVAVTISAPSGLVASINSDATATMRFVSVSKAGLPDSARAEKARSIGLKGTVTRSLRDGSVEIYHADGSVLRKQAGASHFVLTSPDGKRRRVPASSPAQEEDKHHHHSAGARHGKGGHDEEASPSIEELLPVEVHAETDPETSSRVLTLVDEDIGGGRTVVVFYPDGARMALFRDGTSIRTDPTKGHVLVESPGFPSLYLDLAVDLTARKHARGEKVPVATGGERVRSRVAMPDGTQVTCTYNTRVTSDVRGKLIVLRPDKTEIVATDSPAHVDACKVLFRPRSTWNGGEEAFQKLCVGDPQEAPVTEARIAKMHQSDSPPRADSVGVYEFNLFHGRLTMEDTEHNVFYASVNPEKVEKNEKGATYDVELAGKLQGDDDKAEAVVVDPIPPRLFVMSRDGSASELLRPADVSDFAKRCALGLKVETSPQEDLTRDPKDRPGSKQLVHHIIFERPKVSTFALAYPDAGHVAWHQHRLPVCARNGLDTYPRASPHVVAPRVVVRRAWEELPPLDAEGRAQLMADIENCNAFRRAREESNGRFEVSDDRDIAAIEAEAAVQKQLQKAMKTAATKRKSVKEGSKPKQTARSFTSVAETEDGEEEETKERMDWKDQEPDSEKESELTPRGMALAEDNIYAEAEAAFSVHAAPVSPNMVLAMPPSALQEALIQVCNRGVPLQEADDLLQSLSSRSHQDPNMVSFDDFFRVCRKAITVNNAATESTAEAGESVEQKKTASSSSPVQSLTVPASKPLTFWDTKAGQRMLLQDDISNNKQQPPRPPDTSMAAGGGISAVRKINDKQSKRGSPTSIAGRTTSDGPSSGENPTATFEVVPSVLDLGSCAAGAVVSGAVKLTNVSPNPARFRVRPGAKTTITTSHKGPVASGEAVTLKIELEVGPEGGVVEDKVMVVSEHHELAIAVVAQVYRTKAAQ